MSSHHFVKEGQEPVLIVGNGELCRYEMLSDILEWSPKIVALDGAILQLEKLQITPDIVIGDLDSINDRRQDNVEYIQKNKQDNTDLEKALDYLIESGSTSFTLIGCSGKRLDHTINNIMSLAKYSEYEITLIDNHTRMFFLKHTFSKHYKKGQIISLLPLPFADKITTSNLTYSLVNESLSLTKRSGTSNSVKADGIVTIQYEEGLLCILESFDEV